MTNVRHLIVDLRTHAHEVPEHIGALMRRAASELERHAIPNCSVCSDSGQMVVGEARNGGVLVASCACQGEQANAAR